MFSLHKLENIQTRERFLSKESDQESAKTANLYNFSLSIRKETTDIIEDFNDLNPIVKKHKFKSPKKKSALKKQKIQKTPKRISIKRSKNRCLSSESFEKLLKDQITEGNRETGDSITPEKIGSKKDIEKGHYEYKLGEIIGENYKILTHISDGTFGRVFRVRALNDHKIYALKVIRAVKRYIESAKEETRILKLIREKDPEGKYNFVRLIDDFDFKENYCMVFEKLGVSLYDVLVKNEFQGLPIDLLKKYAKQILTALSFLHSLGITHTDLKPENILLTSNKFCLQNYDDLSIVAEEYENKSCSEDSYINEDESLYFYPLSDSIKIIDLGGATEENGLHSPTITTRQYRAPEVYLGCSEWTTSSDIWSLGCIFVELYCGKLLFNTHDSYEHLALIEKIAGTFPYWMANRCDSQWEKNFILEEDKFKKENTYFDWPRFARNQYSIEKVRKAKTLNEIINKNDSDFLNLVSQMLTVNPKKRINCINSLQHKFFS